MAFPTLAAVAATNGSTAALDPAITLPSGLASGDLCIVFFTSTTTHTTPVVPSGWTYLVSSKPGTDARSGDRDQILYRFCDGTEGTSLVIDTGASSVKHVALALRITGVDTGVAPQISSAGIGTSNAPDPASVTPSGTKDFLFIAFAAIEGTAAAPSTPPTNYSHPTTFTVATTGGSAATNARQCIATRTLNTGTAENPSAWGAWGASEDWVAWTLAVHPSAGGGTQFNQSLPATSTFSPVLARQSSFFRTLSVASTFVPSSTKTASFFRTLAVASTFAASIVKAASFVRTLAAVSTFAAGLVASRVFLKALDVASTFAPGIADTYIAGRTLAVSSAMSVGMTKQIGKLLVVTSPMTVAMQRRIFLTLRVTSAFGVEMRRLIGKGLAVSSAFNAGLAEAYRTTRTLSVSGGTWAGSVATHFIAAGGSAVRRVMMLLGVGH